MGVCCHVLCAHILFLQILLFCTTNLLAVISGQPKIVYMDGQSRWDSCLPGLKRSVSGESGLLISHSAYGTQPYNGSKNCFLSVTVPLGYRIRIKALDFDVVGDGRRCDKDTLHIFDHEQPIDPLHMDHLSMDQRTPGQILGQYCGKYPASKNSSKMAESTHNTLTLWWHTDSNLARATHQAEGFRLLWSSFRARTSTREECRKEIEFGCTVGECIPVALGCNVYADCADGSDLDKRLQVQHNCEHIPGDVFSQLTGIKKLLICLLVVLLFTCTCFFCCACFYMCRPGNKARKQQQQQHSADALLTANNLHHSQDQFEGKDVDSNLTQAHLVGGNPPLPPNFSPPQVPSKMTVSVPRVVVIQQKQQQQQGTLHHSSNHHHHQQPPFAVPENSSAIASSSSSQNNNQSTASSLTTTAIGNPSLPGRTTHLPATSTAVQPRTAASTSQTQQRSGTTMAPAGASINSAGDYTYVQNEQKHLLL